MKQIENMRLTLISEQQATRTVKQLSRWWNTNTRLTLTGGNGNNSHQGNRPDTRMNQSQDTMRSFDVPEDIYASRAYI